MFPIIIKNRKNYESPESTLHKLYDAKSSINIHQELKTLDVYPRYFNRNNKITIENLNSQRSQRNLFKPEINNIKTENTDYNHNFCSNFLNISGDNFHNTQRKNKESISHLNEEFINLNDAIQKLKFLDYLKSKPIFSDNNFNKETVFQANIFTSANFNKNFNKIEKTNPISNSMKPFHTVDSEKNLIKLKYKAPYLSNFNQYSIKESFSINNLKNSNNKKNFTKEYLLRGKSHVYPKDIINKNLPSPYYDEYNKNLKNGFKKEKNWFDDYFKNSLNEYILKDSGHKKIKINRLSGRLQPNPTNLRYENKQMNFERQNCVFRKKFPKKKLIHLY